MKTRTALLSLLFAPSLALADGPSSQPAGDADSDETRIKYKANRGFVVDLGESSRLRLDAYGQLEATNDPDVVDVQGSPVIPRRLKVSLRGEVTDYVSFKFGVDFAPLFDLSGANVEADDDDGEFLNDAWVAANFSDKLFLRAGYFKTPFGRQRINSSSALLLLNRSQVNGQFTFDRGAGVVVGGELDKKKLEYQAGVTADVVLANFLGVEAVPVAVARVVANPKGPLKDDEGSLELVKSMNVSFGANVALPAVSNNDTGNPTFGLDVAVEKGRLFGSTEFFVRARQLEDPVICQAGDPACDGVPQLDGTGDIDAGDIIGANANGQTQIQPGFYAQGGVLVVPKRFQLGARVGVLGPDPDFSDGNQNGVFNNNDNITKTELSFSGNAFLIERRVMLQTMLSTFFEDGNAEPIFTLQLQGAL